MIAVTEGSLVWCRSDHINYGIIPQLTMSLQLLEPIVKFRSQIIGYNLTRWIIIMQYGHDIWWCARRRNELLCFVELNAKVDAKCIGCLTMSLALLGRPGLSIMWLDWYIIFVVNHCKRKWPTRTQPVWLCCPMAVDTCLFSATIRQVGTSNILAFPSPCMHSLSHW